jgi:hypothetical protein
VSESSITQWHIIRKLTEFLSLPSHHRNKLKPPQLNQKTTVTDSNHHNRINHHHKFLKFIPVLYQNSSSNEQNHFKVPENRNKMCSIQQEWFEFSEGSQWFSVKIIIIEPLPSQFKHKVRSRRILRWEEEKLKQFWTSEEGEEDSPIYFRLRRFRMLTRTIKNERRIFLFESPNKSR